MRAAVLYERNQPMVVETVDLAAPAAGEVTVRLAAAGVCHSDLHGISGDLQTQLPVVLGHEGAGTVTAVGPGVHDLAVGDSVVLSWTPACGHCYYCEHGRPNLCDGLATVYAGGTLPAGGTRLSLRGEPLYHFIGVSCFAEHAVVPASGAVRVPPGTDLATAALLGCAVTTGVGAALNTAQVTPGANCAVFGTGGVGLNVIQGCRLAGAARVIAVDLLDSKLERATAFGATHTINAGRAQAHKVIRSLTGGRGADYAFEVVGNPQVATTAFLSTAKGGTLVCVGLAPVKVQYSFDAYLLVAGEKRVVGSFYGSANPRLEIPRLLELHQLGRLQLGELITHRFGLSEINAAVSALQSGEAVRPLLVFD